MSSTKLLRIGTTLTLVLLAGCNGGGSGGGGSDDDGSGGSGAGSTSGDPTSTGTGASSASCTFSLDSFEEIPTSTAADGTFLYVAMEGGPFGDPAAGVIRRFDRADPEQFTDVVTGVNEPRHLRLQGDTLVWWQENGDMFPTLDAAPKDGSAPARKLADLNGIDDFVTDDQYVYWVEVSTFTIHRTPLDGSGTTTDLGETTYDTTAIAIDGDSLYYSDGAGSIGTAEIFRMPKAGGASVQLASDLDAVKAMTVDDGWLYFVSGRDVPEHSVRRIPIDATGIVEPQDSVTGLHTANHLLAADSALYVAGLGEGAAAEFVVKVTPGGTPASLGEAYDNPRGLSLDDQCVYWVDKGPADVVRSAPR